MASDINALPSNISAVEEKLDIIHQVLTQSFWNNIEPDKVDGLMDEFTHLMKYRKPQARELVITDLKDEIIERRWIHYADNQKMESDKYRAIFEQQMEDVLKDHPTIQKILNDELVGKEDIALLEDVLQKNEYHIDLTNLRAALNRPTVSFEQLIRVALGK